MCAEAVELVQRFWSTDLEVEMSVSSNSKEVHISVGASYEILVDEANEVQPFMRMADYKGMMKFDSSRTAHFAPSRFEDPALATCFTSALQQQLVWSRIVRLAGVNLRDRMEFLPRDEGMKLIFMCIKCAHRWEQ